MRGAERSGICAHLKWLFEQLARREWSADQARHALLPEHFAALKQGEQ